MNKFAQNWREIDGSVLIVSGKELHNFSITNTQQLEKILPGLQLKVGNGAGGAGAAIRGLGTSSFYNARMAIYVDGIPQDNEFLAQEMIDVKNVELLRGPQGTLYGRGSYAGLVNIITHSVDSPVLRLKGISELSYLWENISTSASSPLIKDWLYIGGNLGYIRYNGMLTDPTNQYIDNKPTNLRVDTSETWNGNVSIVLAPKNSGFLAHFKYSSYFLSDFHNSTSLDQEKFDKKILHYTDSKGLPYNNINTQTYSFKLEQKIINSTLSNVLSYQNYDYNSKSYGEERRKTITEELHFTTLYDNGAYSIVGMYYQNADYKTDMRAWGSGLNHTSYHSFALYGDGKIPFGNFDIDLGLRYSLDYSKINFEAIDVSQSIQDNSSQHIITPKAALGYNINPNNRVYLLYSAGYVSGGYSIWASNTSAAKPYKAEKSQNIELGIHSSLWENKIDLNAAIFGIYITDKQFSRKDPDDINKSLTSNAGTAYSTGLEFAIKTIPISTLQLSLSGAFTKAAYIKATDPIAHTSLNGKTLVFAPIATVNSNVDWNFLNISSTKLFFGLNANFYSKIYFQDDNNEYSAQKPYFLLDGALRIEFKKFSLNIFVNNAFNVLYNRYAWSYSKDKGTHWIGETRNIGLSLKYEL